MAQAVALGGQLRALALPRVGGLDLVQLEAQQVELPVAGAGQLAQLRRAAVELPHPLVGVAHPGAQGQLIGAAVGVQQLQLGGGEHQLAMLVLAVEGEQARPQLLKVGLGGRSPADVGAGAPVGPHPPGEHDLLAHRSAAARRRPAPAAARTPPRRRPRGRRGARCRAGPGPPAEGRGRGRGASCRPPSRRSARSGRRSGAAAPVPSTAGSRRAVRTACPRCTTRPRRTPPARAARQRGVASRPNFLRSRW